MNRMEALQPEFKTGLKRSLSSIAESSWSKNNVGINVVFGIGHPGLPARFLAGFAPAFSLAELIAEKKSNIPELRVFVPLHLSVNANQIPQSHGEQTIRQGMIFIQKFQEIFHPTISWFLDIDNPLTQEGIDLLIHLSNQVLQTHDTTLAQSWEKTFRAAQKRGNKDSAKIYTSHHIFGWHDAWDPQKFFSASPKRITINCFSTSEAKFQPVRKLIMNLLINQKPHLVVHGDHLDMFTDRCPGPHYLPRTIGSFREPLLGDLLNAGFSKVRRELVGLVSLGFRTALLDLDSIQSHIEKSRMKSPTLPNIEDFIQEVHHAVK